MAESKMNTAANEAKQRTEAKLADGVLLYTYTQSRLRLPVKSTRKENAYFGEYHGRFEEKAENCNF